MAYTTLSSGLTLQVPTSGSRNWGSTILAQNFSKISSHDHTGGGKGLQIANSALATDAVTSTKLRLANNTFLGADTLAGVKTSLLGLDTSDQTILQGVTAMATIIRGGSTSAGGLLVLYGAGHATNPGRIDLTAGTAAGSLVLSTRAAAATVNIATNGGTHTVFNDVAGTLNLNRVPTAATAGASQGYFTIQIAGTDRKVQYYAT